MSLQSLVLRTAPDCLRLPLEGESELPPEGTGEGWGSGTAPLFPL